MGPNCLCQAKKVHTVSPLVFLGYWLQDVADQNLQMLESLWGLTIQGSSTDLFQIERVWLNPWTGNPWIWWTDSTPLHLDINIS